MKKALTRERVMRMLSNRFERLDSMDLEELADLISEHVRNPITIEDARHRLVAYSTHGDSTDLARRETIMRRQVPEAVLNRLWQDGVIEQLMSHEDPIRISAKNEVGLGDRVAISIRKGQSVLGYIWVQEVRHQLTAAEMDVLRQAAQAAMPKLFQRQTKRRIQESKSKELFWELLLGNRSSHYKIQERAEEIELRLPKTYTIFIFESGDSELQESIQKEMIYLLSSLRETISLRQFPLWVTKQKQIVIMAGVDEQGGAFLAQANQFVDQMIHRIHDRFAQALPLTGAFGLLYSSYESVEVCYHQALRVLRMKRAFPQETASVYGYADLGLYRLLPGIAEQNAAEAYQNPRLLLLEQYDQENQSDLLLTLEVLLDCAQKMNTASARLHIHPNTLAYRIKRMNQVAGINLEDASQRTSLFIDLKMRRLAT
jgi:DNA-binding PucR family transcriptional regulator